MFSKIQFRWWSVPLALLLTVALFMALDSCGVTQGVSGLLRSLFVGSVSVILLYGINRIAAKQTSSR
ncbi:hypothetical protein AB6V67_26805 [Serratia marcescens]|uniref:Uncharacterized protein n=1 Tax=Serratia marcescens TaxID=615 RepID=A0AB33FJB8_SERMA|nr:MULTISPECIES: hypothetical protein [Serratia]AKL43972.1 hypothetical protein AB188_27215 [Serratia marcescens]AWL66612.1 hypothetical protein DKC05_02470 [Serratia marcescens]EGT0502797.1 hypothetical protein [Serratia marcescens]EHT9829858.1 hypothetical protein [Serratia marcescens]EIU0970795.1 hypothetical protein [Serratia marcescens]